MELKEYLVIPYHEFDELAKSLPDVPDDYEVVAYEELGNDRVYEVQFDATEPFNSIEMGTIKDGKWEFNVRLIMKLLAKGGKLPIEKGTALIDVCW